MALGIGAWKAGGVNYCDDGFKHGGVRKCYWLVVLVEGLERISESGWIFHHAYNKAVRD